MGQKYYESVEVIATKYQTKDGKYWDTEKAAERHGKVLAGVARVCPSCNGTCMVDPYGDGVMQTRCGDCDGTGLQERVQTWRPIK